MGEFLVMSKFVFCLYFGTLPNKTAESSASDYSVQVILVFNIRAADSANHSAFQCLGTLILQIILLFNVWAD
jgi:hypothetical protein